VIAAPSETARRGRLSLKNGVALASAVASCFSLSQQERWYVASTLPPRELQAAKQLANQDFRAFLPLLETAACPPGRTISAPLFPRYIFVIPMVARPVALHQRHVGGRASTDAGATSKVPHGWSKPHRFSRRGRQYRFSSSIEEGQTLR
jgi:hypothetical protein